MAPALLLVSVDFAGGAVHGRREARATRRLDRRGESRGGRVRARRDVRAADGDVVRGDA